MEFGVGPVTAQQVPFDNRDLHEIYQDNIEVLAAAEEYGFSSCWVTEHHFLPDGHVTSPLSFLAAIAAKTDEIQIGSGILIPSFYDPVKLAEDTATIDQISGGRLTVGLGVGYRDEEFQGFNIPKGERTQRLKETTVFLKRAWQQDDFSFDGDIYQYEDLTVTPKPCQEPRPDIWLGAISEGAVRRAAALGDRWFAGQFHSLKGIQKRIDWFRNVDEDEDKDFPVLRHCFVSEDGAWETVRDSVEYIERQHYRWDDTEWSPGALNRIQKNGLFGTPDEVAEQIRTYDETINEDLNLVLWFCYPGVPTDEIIDSMELFHDEVLPQVEG
jgi:alkanesulfonate monooxygenase SsuD/methylene tetrahydromethanopterin reductase-like flavin-dependent oxidoreductase (luciferase family)